MKIKLYYVKFILTTLIAIHLYNNCYANNDINLKYHHPRLTQFSNTVLPKLNKFSDTYLSYYNNHTSVLYPFGGPDVIYPILLFPWATTYTLIGLERINNNVEDLSKINTNFLNENLDSLLRRSFFVTSDMNYNITSEYGVLPLLIAQLNMLNCKVESFKYLNFDFGNSIEITFNYLGIQRKLNYLKSNLQNEYLINSLLEHLSNNNLLDICMIKSDSYNLHKREFSYIKEFIINQANIILQDDSGIPISQLQKDYKINLFGDYKIPYGKEWINYTQKTLVDMYKLNQSIDKINFCYGYGCGKVSPAIILAIRKSITPH